MSTLAACRLAAGRQRRRPSDGRARWQHQAGRRAPPRGQITISAWRCAVRNALLRHRLDGSFCLAPPRLGVDGGGGADGGPATREPRDGREPCSAGGVAAGAVASGEHAADAGQGLARRRPCRAERGRGEARRGDIPIHGHAPKAPSAPRAPSVPRVRRALQSSLVITGRHRASQRSAALLQAPASQQARKPGPRHGLPRLALPAGDNVLAAGRARPCCGRGGRER